VEASPAGCDHVVGMVTSRAAQTCAVGYPLLPGSNRIGLVAFGEIDRPEHRSRGWSMQIADAGP